MKHVQFEYMNLFLFEYAMYIFSDTNSPTFCKQDFSKPIQISEEMQISCVVLLDQRVHLWSLSQEMAIGISGNLGPSAASLQDMMEFWEWQNCRLSKVYWNMLFNTLSRPKWDVSVMKELHVKEIVNEEQTTFWIYHSWLNIRSLQKI